MNKREYDVEMAGSGKAFSFPTRLWKTSPEVFHIPTSPTNNKKFFKKRDISKLVIRGHFYFGLTFSTNPLALK